MRMVTACFMLAAGMFLAGLATGMTAGTHHYAQSGQALPPGYHMRTARYQVDDCGRHNKGQVKAIFWKGTGDRQSAIACPDGTWQPS